MEDLPRPPKQIRLTDSLRAQLVQAALHVIDRDPLHQPVQLSRFAQLLLQEGLDAILAGEGRSLRKTGQQLAAVPSIRGVVNCPRFVHLPQHTRDSLAKAAVYVEEHDPWRRPVSVSVLALMLIEEGCLATIRGRIRPLARASRRRTSSRGRKARFVIGG